MAVPRTPRPPIVLPKPAERALDPMEIERWVGRLARAIRLKRLEQGFLGSGRKGAEPEAVGGPGDGGAAGLG